MKKNGKNSGKILTIVIVSIVVLAVLAVGIFTVNYFRPVKRKIRHFQKGLIYLQQAKYAVAIKELQAALNIDPKELEIRYQLARAHFLYEEREKAIEQVEKIIEQMPTEIRGYDLLADIYVIIASGLPLQKDEKPNEERRAVFQKAIGACDKMIELKPNAPEHLNKRGLILLQMDELEKAESDFNKAIALDPKDGKGYLNLARLYWATKRTEQACSLLETYLKEKDPKQIECRIQLGEFYIEQRKFKEALAHFEYLDNLQPDSYDKIMPGLSLSLLGLSEIDKAMAVAQKGLQKILAEKEERYARAKIIMTYVLGSTQLIKKDYEAAAKNLLWAYDKAPLFADVLYKLAIAYQLSGKTGLAIEKLQEGVKANPGAIPLRITLIELLASESQWDKAEVECDRLLKDAPNEMAGLRLKARILLAQGKEEPARKIYEKIIEIAPESAEGQIGLAVIEMAKSRFKEALEILKKANEDKPKDATVTFLMGQAYVGMNDLEEGLKAIEETLKIDINFTAARILMARIRMLQEALPLAVNEYEELYKSSPDNIRVLLELALLYLRMGNPDKALEVIQQNKSIDLDDPIFLEVFARLYFAKRDYNKALDYMNKISNHTAPHKMLLGDIYYALGKYDEAIESFKKAVLIDPKTMVHGPMAIALYMKKQYKDAAEELRIQLEQTPQSDLLRMVRAMVLLLDKSLDEALEETKFVLKEDNANRWLGRLIRAGVFVEQKQFEQANQEVENIPDNFPYLKDLKQIIKLCQEQPNVHLKLLVETVVLQELGRLEEALVKCEETIKMFPDQIIPMYSKALIFTNLGRMEEARVILEKLMNMPGAPMYVYNRLAALYIQKQEYDKAEQCYLKALKMRPESNELMLALGMLYETDKKIDKAIAQYQKILKVTEAQKEQNLTTRIIALNNLAWLYLESGKDPKIALNYARESFDASRYSWAIADTLGWAYYFNNEYQQALRYLNYARNLKPDYPSIHYHLGKVYHKLNKKSEAKDALQKALSLSKDFREVKDAEDLLKSLEK